ncbi:hypothetical protein Taro_021011, partial [Colocasia esculenta]|nr:hypothetical protein [Colocasia esculenta]
IAEGGQLGEAGLGARHGRRNPCSLVEADPFRSPPSPSLPNIAAAGLAHQPEIQSERALCIGCPRRRSSRVGGRVGDGSRTFCREGICSICSCKDFFDVVMESKGGKKKSSSSRCLEYEAPLGYSIEDVRPNGGIEKFHSAAYSNCVRKPS